MIKAGNPYRKLVLVCMNERAENADCCMKRGAGDVYPKLKAAIKERYSDVRVSKTGCLGNCLTGTSVVVMPDDAWLGEVTEEDIEEILNMLS